MTATLALVPEPTTTLVDEINHAYQQAEHAWKNTLQHALRCGELLHQAKLDLDHGTWTGWLGTNFAGSQRTAQQYMQLAEAKRDRPELLETLDADSITQAVRAIARPAQRPSQPAGDPEPTATVETFTLTLPQLSDLIRSMGGQTTEDRVRRWIERLTEPKATLCPDCQAPVIQVVVNGQPVTANRYEWQPRTACTKCLQTRHAHPGKQVSCPHCNSTGFTGEANRPAGRMLAMDMAWSDTPNVRVIGERTDRREGEALHPIHQCAREQAA